MQVQSIDGHTPTLTRQQVPHPLDNDSLIVELKQMAILGAGIAVEAITGEQKWLQWTGILLHVTSFPAHPSLDSRQARKACYNLQ